jgi:hypothetical protein
MYYIRIEPDAAAAGAADDSASADATTLFHYCRNCGSKEQIKEAVSVSKLQLKHGTQSYGNIINKYTKLDPTLPRINHIKCPNSECPSNPFVPLSAGAIALKPGVAVLQAAEEEEEYAEVAESASAQAHAEAIVKRDLVPREVIYIRYDEVNMRYVYLCAVCDTLWNTLQNSSA